MKKIAVVYWSGTGNTEAMAASVLEGAKDKGAAGNPVPCLGVQRRSGGGI